MNHDPGRSASISAAPVAWRRGAPVAMDFGGPVDRPFVPIPVDDGACDGIAWLERSAQAWPDKIAVADDLVELTYAQLVDRVYGLAQDISAAVPVGGVVVPIIRNSVAMAVALLAGLAAGRTVVPIDAAHDAARQTAILAASGGHAVIVAAGDVAQAPDGIARIVIDPARPSGAAGVPVPTASDVAAVVMFTSGSSGSPKGLAHEVAATDIARFVARFHVNADDVFVTLASLSQTGIADLMCLAAGATLHIVDVKRRGIGEALAVIRDRGVTFLSFVPSVLRMLVAVPGIAATMKTLRVLDLHGERILASDIARLRTILPAACHISISYGATEVGLVFSWFVRDEAIVGDVAPIGYVAPHKAVALLPWVGMPEGERQDSGELLVRGLLALGSWVNGRLSGERFMRDPDHPRQLVYNMGDIVRLRADGLAEFVGRRDRNVKIRGLWVNLDEVETALRASDGVLDAVALVSVTAGEADEIIAFVVPERTGAPPDRAMLQAQVGEATASHMAPGRILSVATIPRLANFKPDLQQLGAQAGSRLAEGG